MTEEIRLLQSSKTGDTAAFEKIVNRYQSMVCAITFSGTGRVDTSEDLAQETFLRAWKNLGQLKDLAGFRAWLCAIARNVLHNHYRQKKTVSLDQSDPDSFSSGSENPSETLIHQEELVMLEQALMQIPAEYREPLVMFYRQQQSTRDVAESLGLNESTVRTRLHRARQMLREEIAARLERTLQQTAPGRTFTKSVMVAVGGAAIGMSAGASAASATTGAVASTGMATVMSTLTAKVIAAAAVAVIAVGAVFAYKHLLQSDPLPVQSDEMAPVRNELEPVVIAANTAPALPNTQEAAANLSEASAPQISAVPSDLDTQDAAAAEPSSISQTIEIPESSEYVFQPKGVLSGLITDKDTGDPVVDAEIIIYGVSVRNGRLVTDANGFYSLETVDQSKAYEIAITSKDYVGKPDIDDDHKIVLEKEKQQVVHFQLEKACLVDLWVKDEQGNPVRGAKITVIDLVTNQATAMSRSGTFKSTDKNGYMRIGGHPASKAGYMVMITRENFAPAHFIINNTDPAIITAFDVTLKTGKAINGYIEYSDGVPAADLKIVAETEWWSTTNQSGQMTDVSSDGTFTLAHVTPEKYCISAYYPVERSYKQIRNIDFAQHEGDIHLTLSEPSPQSLLTIKGKVKVIKKAPVGNLYIDIDSFNTSTNTRGNGTSIWKYDDNDEAEFTVDRLTEGRYRLTFQSEHFEKVTLENIQPPVDDIYVVMEQIVQPEIEVKVVDKATGEPVTNMKARLIKTAYKDNRYGVTDQWLERSNPQGRAFFTVTHGVYQVHIMADGYALGISEDIDTDDIKPVTIELTKGGAIKGRVINPAGQPVAGAEILALSYAGSYRANRKSDFITKTKAVSSDANGNFVIEGLPEGLETIKAVHKDYAPAIVRDIAVMDGKVSEAVVVQLKEAAAIEGYVFDNDSKVIANTRLDYDQDRNSVITQQNTDFVVTDPNGFYRIEGLAEVSYYIARNRGWFAEGVCSRTITPVCGEVTRLDFGGGGHVVTGTVMVDDVPSANMKLALGSNDWEQFLGYTMTDADGHFVFTGVVEGKYYIEPVDDFRTTLACVDVVDTDVDLGIIGSNLVDFEVVIVPDQGWEKLQQVGVLSSPIYVLAQQRDELDKQRGLWRLVNIAPGTYDLSIYNDKATGFTVKINVEEEQAEPFIITPPKLDAVLAGFYYQSVSNETMPQYILLSNDDQTISAYLIPQKDGLPDTKGEFEVKLPAGHYHISYTDGNEKKVLKECDISAGQNMRLEIDLDTNIE